MSLHTYEDGSRWDHPWGRGITAPDGTLHDIPGRLKSDLRVSVELDHNLGPHCPCKPHKSAPGKLGHVLYTHAWLNPLPEDNQ